MVVILPLRTVVAERSIPPSACPMPAPQEGRANTCFVYWSLVHTWCADVDSSAQLHLCRAAVGSRPHQAITPQVWLSGNHCSLHILSF